MFFLEKKIYQTWKETMSWSDPGEAEGCTEWPPETPVALMIQEGDLQTHMNWPQPSLGLLLFPHFGQSSHFIH